MLELQLDRIKQARFTLERKIATRTAAEYHKVQTIVDHLDEAEIAIKELIKLKETK